MAAECTHKDKFRTPQKSNHPHKSENLRKPPVQVAPQQKPIAKVADSKVNLSRPQRRRLNKRLRKEKLLQEQAKNQNHFHDKTSSVKTENRNKQNVKSDRFWKKRGSGVGFPVPIDDSLVNDRPHG